MDFKFVLPCTYLGLEFFILYNYYNLLVLKKLKAKVEVIMLGWSNYAGMKQGNRHVRIFLGNNYKHSIIAVTQIQIIVKIVSISVHQ